MPQPITTTQTSVLVVIGVVVTVSIGGAIASPPNVIPILGFSGVICASLFTLLKVETTSIETKVALNEATAKTQIARSETTKKLTDIHTLVNSNMSIQLKVSAAALRRVADLTNDHKDVINAELAENALAEHEASQKHIDDTANQYSEHRAVEEKLHVTGSEPVDGDVIGIIRKP